MTTSDPVRILEPIYKHQNEDEDFAFDFTDRLEDATLSSISGSDPNGVALGCSISPATGAPDIDAEEINSGALSINGRTIAIGKGVSVTFSGGTASSSGPTEFEVTCNARTSDGRTVTAIGKLILTKA